MNILYNSIIPVLIVLLLLGCSQKQNIKTLESLPELRIEEQISILKEITQIDGRPELRAMAHLELSKLYFNNSNLQSNYARALEELEKYAVLEPEKSDCLEIKGQLAILREIRKLKKINGLLNEEILLLKETINKLNSLDIELEMKREKVKQQTP